MERSRVRELIASVFVTAAIVTSALGAPASAAPGVVADADWMLLAQLPDGSIASHADRTFVNPYLAGFAAAGLSAATRVTGNPVYAEAAWRFVDWYVAHMDPHGYVSDYRVAGSTLVSTGDADSTDAYAGVFLLAIEAANAATPNLARVRALVPAMRRAIDAIRSTQRPDGLTGAKPTWMVAYLMNQAEVFAGLQAAARLAMTAGEPPLARDATLVATRIQRGVARLWNPSTRSLDWAVHEDGRRQQTSWAQLYPDALSQVWAVRYGLLQGPRARAVLDTFLQLHPRAHDPHAPDLVDGKIAPTGYWPGIAGALGLVDAGAPGRYLAGAHAAAAASGRSWPYSVQTAGDVVRLTSGF